MEKASQLYTTPTSVIEAEEYVAAIDEVRPRHFTFVELVQTFGLTLW